MFWSVERMKDFIKSSVVQRVGKKLFNYCELWLLEIQVNVHDSYINFHHFSLIMS